MILYAKIYTSIILKNVKNFHSKVWLLYSNWNILHSFKPTNGKFCREELSNLSSRFKARTACYLLDFLIASTSPEAEKILDDFVKDIQVQ